MRNRRFQFHKRSQLFICVHNKEPSVAVRVNNPDRSPSAVNGCDDFKTINGKEYKKARMRSCPT